jgi:hypothetical protein
MKRLMALCALLSLSIAGTAQKDNSVTINPKIGTNFSGISDQPNGISTKNKVGYNAGFDIRFGGDILYFQPGVFFYQYNQEYTVVATQVGATGSFTSDIKVQSLKVPVLLGVRVFSSDPLTLRLNAGPAFNFPVNVDADKDSFAISSKNYNNANVGGVVGAGVDLAFFTFDINYEFGLSDYIDFSESNNLTTGSSKQYVISLNVGVKF